MNDRSKLIGQLKFIRDYECKTDAEIRAMNEAITALSEEPQERKTGQWIYHIDDLFPTESTMECSECHEHQYLTCDDNFCPNCGCKMEAADGND